MAHKHMCIKCYLIVAAARRVQTTACIADRVREAFFDIHMNIFEFYTERKFSVLDLREDITQSLLDCRTILFRENTRLGKHGGVRKRTCDVLAVHATIKSNGCLKLVDHLIGRLGKATTPELFAHLLCSSCMSARTLSGSPKRLIKPVASA